MQRLGLLAVFLIAFSIFVYLGLPGSAEPLEGARLATGEAPAVDPADPQEPAPEVRHKPKPPVDLKLAKRAHTASTAPAPELDLNGTADLARLVDMLGLLPEQIELVADELARLSPADRQEYILELESQVSPEALADYESFH